MAYHSCPFICDPSVQLLKICGNAPCLLRLPNPGSVLAISDWMGKSAKVLPQIKLPDLPNEVRNFVNAEVRHIVRIHDANPDRVKTVLKRTVRATTQDGWVFPVAWFLDKPERKKLAIPPYGPVVLPGYPFRDISSRSQSSEKDRHFVLSDLRLKGNAPILTFIPSLRKALEPSQKNRASVNHVLTIFESEDIEKMSQELWFLDELKRKQGPAFTLHELAETLSAFIYYLRHQKEYGRILETGEPFEEFPCVWLHQRLSPLYFDHPDFEDDPPSRKERSKLLELKLEVLGVLKNALAKKSPAGLIDNCIEIIKRHLTWREVDWFFRQDIRYIDLSLRKKPKDGSELFHSGGLTDLIELIGYCEKELTIGVMAKTADALIRSGIFRMGEYEISEADYFEIPLAKRVQFTEILDLCRELHDEEILGPKGPPKRSELIEAYGGLLKMRKELPPKPFWGAFTERVNSELIEKRIEKLFAELNQGPLKFTAKSTGFERPFTRFLHMENTPYKFQRKRKGWLIGYRGFEFELPDSPGLNCVAYILTNQGNSSGVPATVLYEKFSAEKKTAESHAKYAERSQRAVFENISDAIALIERRHEPLGEYLRKEILNDNGRTTSIWYYLSENRLPWNVQLSRSAA